MFVGLVCCFGIYFACLRELRKAFLVVVGLFFIYVSTYLLNLSVYSSVFEYQLKIYYFQFLNLNLL